MFWSTRLSKPRFPLLKVNTTARYRGFRAPRRWTGDKVGCKKSLFTAVTAVCEAVVSYEVNYLFTFV